MEERIHNVNSVLFGSATPPRLAHGSRPESINGMRVGQHAVEIVLLQWLRRHLITAKVLNAVKCHRQRTSGGFNLLQPLTACTHGPPSGSDLPEWCPVPSTSLPFSPH